MKMVFETNKKIRQRRAREGERRKTDGKEK